MRYWLLLTAILGLGGFAQADEKYVLIKGQVKWNGDKAPAAPLVNFNGHADTKACCVKGPLASTEMEVDPKSLGVKNVVVYFRADDPDREIMFPLAKVKPDLAKAKSKEHVIDQPMCQFEPRITVARAGDTLVVKNSAGIPHNVNYSSDIESINPILPANGEVKLTKALAAQRLPILLKCDIHSWMKAQVRVFDHPYFALTDKDGKFEIRDLPAGTWRIVYSHELGFHQSKPESREGILGHLTTIKGDQPTVELDPIMLQFFVKPADKK